MKHISSRDNPLVKQLHALATSGRERRKLGRTLLDGAHLIEAYLDRVGAPEQLLVSGQGLEDPEIAALVRRVGAQRVVCLADPLFAHGSPVDAPSGVMAVIAIPPAPASPGQASCVLLEAVQDAGNVGSILRSAAAAGIREAILTPGCAQAWSPRVLRAGMGAHFSLAIREHLDPALALGGFAGSIVATTLAGGRSLYDMDLRGPVAWLFGAEGAGLSEATGALATARVSIPMPGGAESLNVAAAAAVCLFEQVRQQRSDHL